MFLIFYYNLFRERDINKGTCLIQNRTSHRSCCEKLHIFKTWSAFKCRNALKALFGQN